MGEKMRSKIKISAALVAIFLLAVLAVNLAAASTSVIGSINTSSVNAITPSNAGTEASANIKTNTNIVATTNADDLSSLKANIPKTFEEAEASILPVRNRYLMYTSDGVHIMWGVYGKGLFVGTDNQGKRAWGIYGQGVFAGFYDGEFFWGRFSNGAWKAEYLFGLRYSHGNYVLFPPPVPTATTAEP